MTAAVSEFEVTAKTGDCRRQQFLGPDCSSQCGIRVAAVSKSSQSFGDYLGSQQSPADCLGFFFDLAVSSHDC